MFRGFCNRHDTEIFKELDTLDFDPSLENCVRLIYRSVCREISVNQHVVKVLFDSSMGKDERFFEERIAPEITRTKYLVQFKLGVEAAMSSGNYSDYEGLVFELSAPPSFIGTTTFIPIVTPRGRSCYLEWNGSL